MITELPVMEMPQWLKAILDNPEEKHTFKVENIVKDSLYYPACRLDGTPVRNLAGNIYSFVYADYGVSKHSLLWDLRSTTPPGGCRGYEMILQQEIFRYDIVPAGWAPSIVPHNDNPRLHSLRYRERQCRPFGHWSVWRRLPGFDDSHGPEGFSLFYLGGEMSAIYQGIYIRLNTAPKMLAIIQPGAIGGEWEAVPDPKSFFHHVVTSNPGGMPEFLIYGGFGRKSYYQKPCWDEYGGEHRMGFLPQRNAGIWKLDEVNREV